MGDTRIIRIRRGMNGFPYSACTSDGNFICNADDIKQIRSMYEMEIKMKHVRLVKELDMFPAGYEPQNVVYGYARVSSRGQAVDGNSLDTQEKKLREKGAQVIIREIYTGTSSDRPEFEKLMKTMKGGDTLMVTRLDRIARSVRAGEEIISQLRKRHITVHILDIGILDYSETGNLLVRVFLAFSEFERDMIVARTQEGKAEAKKKPGFREGRPRTEKSRLDHAMALLEQHSYKKVSELTGISVSTLTREKQRMKARKQILGGILMKTELVTLFLRELKGIYTDYSAGLALSTVNEEYIHRLQKKSQDDLAQELLDLYDAAREFDVNWPSPIGRHTSEALKNSGQYEKSIDAHLQ